MILSGEDAGPGSSGSGYRLGDSDASKPEPTRGSGLPARDRVPVLRIIGIDPGLASIGYGIVDIRAGVLRLVEYGVIETAASEPLESRLIAIYDNVSHLLAQWKPAIGGMESLFFFRNVSSALPVAEARGVIRLAFAKAALPLQELTPNAIKLSVTGSARADKVQVQEMVRILLGLSEVPKPDHAADALAAAICRWHNESTLAKIGSRPIDEANPQLPRQGRKGGRTRRAPPRAPD